MTSDDRMREHNESGAARAAAASTPDPRFVPMFDRGDRVRIDQAGPAYRVETDRRDARDRVMVRVVREDTGDGEWIAQSRLTLATSTPETPAARFAAMESDLRALSARDGIKAVRGAGEDLFDCRDDDAAAHRVLDAWQARCSAGMGHAQGQTLRQGCQANLHVGDVLRISRDGKHPFRMRSEYLDYTVLGLYGNGATRDMHVVVRDPDGRVSDIGGATIFPCELGYYTLQAMGRGGPARNRILSSRQIRALHDDSRVKLAARRTLASGFPFTFTPEQAS